MLSGTSTVKKNRLRSVISTTIFNQPRLQIRHTRKRLALQQILAHFRLRPRWPTSKKALQRQHNTYPSYSIKVQQLDDIE